MLLRGEFGFWRPSFGCQCSRNLIGWLFLETILGLRVATPKTFFSVLLTFMSANNVLLKAEDMVRDYMSRFDSSHDFLHVDRVRRSGMSPVNLLFSMAISSK
jgi:hypothetical protein